MLYVTKCFNLYQQTQCVSTYLTVASTSGHYRGMHTPGWQPYFRYVWVS